MQDFSIYFELGWQHILDWEGYDHILFVTALCGVYLLQDWRKVLVLVTAFTLGHSLTLALSVFDVVQVNSDLIEFLIPVTIIITTLTNIIGKRNHEQKNWLTYAYALFFGLIHGLGFSNYLKSLLGKEASITAPLFAFNVGLEFGQIVIVALVLCFSFVMHRVFGVSRRDWNLFLSSAIFGIAFVMALERV
ncbi:HupE/UreJ family protein [Olivibacter sitiensis]|uniref:HupE/UreJ family protein n=1 Tax=Olivibacter sitiensis TaxID=376470 RepID=UPI00041D971C|nr:HupE/UreJ family protein [Olivibacter sitiensis]